VLFPRRGRKDSRHPQKKEQYTHSERPPQPSTGADTRFALGSLLGRADRVARDHEEVSVALLDCDSSHPVPWCEMPNYEAELLRLYSLQAQISQDPYLHAHSRNLAVIHRQIAIFERFHKILKDAQVILDWGCRHAADACMVRMLCGQGPQLHGCDVDIEEETYRVFFEFAGLKYTRLAHPYLLPYADDTFDVVIGSGVLEHVPNDSESLKELYRIIRPGGYFAMTMLPNRYSYTEWLNRRRGRPGHLRLYSLAEARHMFIHHGFRPMILGYHQVLPTLSSLEGGLFDHPLANRIVERLFGFNSVLERLWPFNKFSTNIFIVGEKVRAFHG